MRWPDILATGHRFFRPKDDVVGNQKISLVCGSGGARELARMADITMVMVLRLISAGQEGSVGWSGGT